MEGVSMEKAPGCGGQRHSLLKMAVMLRLLPCSLIPLHPLLPSLPAPGDSKISCSLTTPRRLYVRQVEACPLKHSDHGAGELSWHPQGGEYLCPLGPCGHTSIWVLAHTGHAPYIYLVYPYISI